MRVKYVTPPGGGPTASPLVARFLANAVSPPSGWQLRQLCRPRANEILGYFPLSWIPTHFSPTKWFERTLVMRLTRPTNFPPVPWYLKAQTPAGGGVVLSSFCRCFLSPVGSLRMSLIVGSGQPRREHACAWTRESVSTIYFIAFGLALLV